MSEIVNDEIEEPFADESDSATACPTPPEKFERERRELLNVIAASKLAKIEHRVAWILNNYPDTRNSDIILQFKYRETFHGGEYNASAITYDDLHSLPRLTSLTRARARVQNTLKLFLADPQVRRRRGTLSEDERKKARADKSASYPVYAVYIDESGKTQPKLVVGSLWFLQGAETLRISRTLAEWRDNSGFREELHFAEVGWSNLARYQEATDIVLANAAALGFKYLAVPRAGAGQPRDLIPKLIYYLLVKGVQHEHESGRAPLPRNLQVWKDAEEVGYDKVVLTDLLDRLKATASARFPEQLYIDVIAAVDSKGNDLLQITDLFTASVNRVINPPNPPPIEPGAKDTLAEYVLTGLRLGAPTAERLDDLAVEITL